MEPTLESFCEITCVCVHVFVTERERDAWYRLCHMACVQAVLVVLAVATEDSRKGVLQVAEKHIVRTSSTVISCM